MSIYYVLNWEWWKWVTCYPFLLLWQTILNCPWHPPPPQWIQKHPRVLLSSILKAGEGKFKAIVLVTGESKVNRRRSCHLEWEDRYIHIQPITTQCDTWYNEAMGQRMTEAERKDRLSLSSEVRAASWRRWHLSFDRQCKHDWFHVLSTCNVPGASKTSQIFITT